MQSFEIPTSLKQLISSNQAFHYRIVPMEKKGDVVVFKTDAEHPELLHSELSIVFNFTPELQHDSSENIQAYLIYNYRQTTTALGGISEATFLEELLQTAKDFNSSDIHLEPYETLCRVRFRLDGKLKEHYQISLNQYPKIINIIKHRAELDVSQKRLPQDGRITVKGVDDDFDIRVSTMPSLHGEKIVLRILKQDATGVELKNLGFKERELKLYLEGIKMTTGIILISGPTGSGKTTTLYGTLKLLNSEEKNILTVEDPIEYTLDGVNQVQLKEDIGLDFPRTLRTFLRQDPNVIMVGEIRDRDTADMAIRAALTGHLVLSTIHTNSAWATVSRLIDMGVPPFLVASTLKLSVAQRLVRKLCDHCKRMEPVTENLFPESFSEKKMIPQHYVSVGCNQCHFTGYSGRKALYEIIPVRAELEQAIKRNALQIDDYLIENDLGTLQSNAIDMIIKGETTVDEVYSLLTN
ncbi:MAG: GspE/PulE family protein [Bacteroidota bacterium]